jgi:hypothetical protein
MASLRAFASCIGCPPDFRIVRDFFGYASAPPWKLAPPGQQANLPQSLSVLKQMNRLKQKHFHLDLIRVGTDSNGLLPPKDEQNLDCAVQMAREIYGAIGVGIGRVDRWWRIPLSDHTGFDIIDDNCEAVDMITEYTAPGGGIDVFLVQEWVDSDNTVGITPHKPDGVAVESRENDFLGTARTVSHELGHYFGLGHENDKPNNLMCQSGKANEMPGSSRLNSDQAQQIKESDAMHPSC